MAARLRAQLGFTLIEILVVMAIVGIVVALAAVRFGMSDVDTLQREAERLSLLLETARDEAIGLGQPIGFSAQPGTYRFWQQDASSRRGYTGLGLGLAIVKHLVDAHGGSVRAESDGEDKGATFTVRLPLLEGTGVSAAAAAVARGEAPSLRGLRILVVDDDVDARRWLTQLLVRAQAEVEITGLDRFDVKDLAEELENALRLRSLEIGSQTFQKEMQKKLALKYLDDSSQEIKNRVAGEIENRL